MNAILRQEIETSDDRRYDPWGVTMSWRFAIADVVTEETGSTPSAWEYRQAMGGPDTEAWEWEILTEGLEDGSWNVDELIHAGNVLARYTRLCQINGRDY